MSHTQPAQEGKISCNLVLVLAQLKCPFEYGTQSVPILFPICEMQHDHIAFLLDHSLLGKSPVLKQWRLCTSLKDRNGKDSKYHFGYFKAARG